MAKTTRSTKTSKTDEKPQEAPKSVDVDPREISELRKVAHAIAEADRQDRLDPFSPVVGAYTVHARAAAEALGHGELGE